VGLAKKTVAEGVAITNGSPVTLPIIGVVAVDVFEKSPAR
jgi:hypothetical protein